MMEAVPMPNPFAYVNGLSLFAARVVEKLAIGESVVALIGPYDAGEFVSRVEQLLGAGDIQPTLLESSVQVVDGCQQGLTVVNLVDGPLAELNNDCVELGAELMVAPFGFGADELANYGIALTSDVSSETYRALVLKLAAGMAAGSPLCYRDLVRTFAQAEGVNFPLPIRKATDYGNARINELASKRTKAKADILDYREYLGNLAFAGVDSHQKRAVRAKTLWAWSRGLSWMSDGLWCPDWSVLVMRGDELDEQLSQLMEDVITRRVGLASTSAMMPVLEKYCFVASSRFVENSCRAGDNIEELCAWYDEKEVYGPKDKVFGRASQISDFSKFSKSSTSVENVWGVRHGADSINLTNVTNLRNRLCHLLPRSISQPMLATFTQVLAVLARLEEDQFPKGSRSVFM